MARHPTAPVRSNRLPLGCAPCAPCDCTCTDLIGAAPNTEHVRIGVPDSQRPPTCLDPCFYAPEHRVTVTTPYWLGRFEVTNQCYRACVDAGTCPAPSNRYYDDQVRGTYLRDVAYSLYPAAGMTFSAARAACRYYGGDLATSAQWEFAARGPDGRDYPWTGSSRCDRGAFSAIGWGGAGVSCVDTNDRARPWGLPTPSPVGSHPSGAGPFGTLDLLGNVAEWTLDYFAVDYYFESAASAAATGREPVDPTGPSGPCQIGPLCPSRVLRGGGHTSNYIPGPSWLFREATEAPYVPPDAPLPWGARCVWTHDPGT